MNTIQDLTHMHKPFSEIYYTIIGYQYGNTLICDLIDMETQYNPGSVEFMWKNVWDRHIEHGDVIGFFHTHPEGCPWMSERDKKTFHSWLVGIGGPRYAVILCDGIWYCWKLSLIGTELIYQHMLIEKLHNKLIIYLSVS